MVGSIMAMQQAVNLWISIISNGGSNPLLPAIFKKLSNAGTTW